MKFSSLDLTNGSTMIVSFGTTIEAPDQFKGRTLEIVTHVMGEKELVPASYFQSGNRLQFNIPLDLLGPDKFVTGGNLQDLKLVGVEK